MDYEIFFSMFDFGAVSIPGVRTIRPRVQTDFRGTFVKTFNSEVFAEEGISVKFTESYYSVSKRHVLRGMHFQNPPHHHDKLVYCTHGIVLDVVVDLRIGSPTFKKAMAVELDSSAGSGIFLPSGCAHGFYTISESAVLLYFVTTVYAPQFDSGIRWDSVGIEWPSLEPILSNRDMTFPQLSEYKSPFNFGSLE